jgi:hypothetical protein
MRRVSARGWVPTGQTGGVTCPIESLRATRRSLEFGRYERLHSDGRALIRGWRERAGEKGRRDQVRRDASSPRREKGVPDLNAP